MEMKCPVCQFDNAPGSQFCANCGKPMKATVPSTNPATPTWRCQHCGTVNAVNNRFCENCGKQLIRENVANTAPYTANKTMQVSQKTGQISLAIWILPVLFGVLGGLMAWGLTRGSDGKKAKNMLVIGIVMTVAWILVGIALSMLF
jgi:hypothetical protein